VRLNNASALKNKADYQLDNAAASLYCTAITRAIILEESMSVELINTDKAPAAVGPYSQAARVGDLLFISGQIPIDPATNELKLFGGDVTEQAKLVLSNLQAVLEYQGLQKTNVAKCVIFVKDMDDFTLVNEVYGSFFGKHRPARACVEVARLPKDVSVEIEAIASF
jgi:2-iminobutanoate/2-iminopropanoate deaminase